jgi:colicin import membrane protein
MFSQWTSYLTDRENRAVVVPFLISLFAHVLLFSAILYTPKKDNKRLFMPSSVINVQMVNLPGGSPESTRTTEAAVGSAAKVPDTASPAETERPKAATPRPESKDSPQAEISIAQQPVKPKTSLKHQTRRPAEQVRPPEPRREERRQAAPTQAAAPPVNPLDETIRRIRERVEQEGRPASAFTEGSGEGGAGTGGGPGGSGFGIRQEVEAIDLYRLEVAFAINRNWAFADQLARDRGEMVASIVFKVMPDGRIEDIFFTDRSGNPHLDESAYRAIVKSSPVRPHPSELKRSYIEMGLRFTPKGVQ